MMKNILLINPPQGVSKKRSLFLPLGLAYIASSLKEETSHVDILDFEVGQRLSKIRDPLSYDLIGITGYINQANYIKGIIQKFRDFGFRKKIVLGGMLPTAIPELSLLYTGADIAVIGEGEETIKEIAKEEIPLRDISGIAYKIKKFVFKTDHRNPPKNLDDLALPAWEEFDIESYLKSQNPYTNGTQRRMDISPTRGCFGECIFCDRENHRIIRRRSLESLMEEVRNLKKQYNIKEIEFQSDLFVTNREWVMSVSDAISRERINYTIDCRADRMDEPLLKSLKNSGCKKIYYGFESASQEVLDFLQKGINVEQIQETIDLHKKYNVDLYSGFMIGVPFESETTIQKNVDFCKLNKISMGLTLPNVLFSSNMFYLTPFPGTKLFELYQNKIELKKFLQSVQTNSEENLLETLTINLTSFSDKKLISLRKSAIKEINSSLE